MSASTYAVLPTLETIPGTSSLGVDNPVLFPAGVPLPEPIVKAAVQASASRVIAGLPVFIFDIPQVVNLTYPASTAYEGIMMNNFPVNRTDFRLIRGVRNEISFFVRDIDRKPVQLAMGETLAITITNDQDDLLLLQRSLSVQDLANGIYQLVTLAAEMDTWPSGPVRWGMTYTRLDGTTVMLWTDQNYSPYSNAYVTRSPFPGPAATTTLMWSDFTVLGDSKYYSAALAAAAQGGYVNGMQTYVIDMTDFTGTVRIDGSLAASPEDTVESSDWFAASTTPYTAFTGQAVLNVPGNFVWTRVVVTSISGTLNQLQYKG